MCPRYKTTGVQDQMPRNILSISFLKSWWLCGYSVSWKRCGGYTKKHLSLKEATEKRCFRRITFLLWKWLLSFQSWEGHCSLTCREFSRELKEKRNPGNKGRRSRKLTTKICLARHFCVDSQIKSFLLLYCENIGRDQIVSYSED